jgi:Kef-type K+ transport system membrane component KefB
MMGAGSEEMLPVLLGLVVILVSAKLGGEAARMFRQPAVLGEIAAGIVLGNLDLIGVSAFAAMAENSHLEVLAQLGVLLLLFEVGLESTVGQMLKTGVSSLLVALIGVVLPMAMGWYASGLLLPDAPWQTHVFVGATLTATSVGITARVLKDLGKSTTIEARTVLGAAVIDDVLGLVVLSVVVGAIAASQAGGSITVFDGLITLGQAAVFLVGSIIIGLTIVPRVYSASSRLASPGVLFALSLAFCFTLSWGAGAIGLAPIVGAFAAGLVLEEVHFRDYPGQGQKELEVLIHPLVSLFAPVFFVMIGMRTDLAAFADSSVLILAGVLLVVGAVGKIAAGLGAVGRGIDRLSIGIGMIPRGEVGLIFANMGLAMGEAVISKSLFSALVIVVMLTTVVTPPLLGWSLTRER